MVEALTPIWQRVLQLPSIHVDDNFFDLGGDSSLALQLFNEIAQVCDRELPPVTIYQAPTIAALAALLEQPTTPRFPTLVLLKPGTEKPPVFVAHGLGGSVMDFFQPVKHIETDHPIYGMRSERNRWARRTVCASKIWPNFLSFMRSGRCNPAVRTSSQAIRSEGLVALEMAQRLSANGDKVALLAMLDGTPHIHYLSLRQRGRLIAHQARRGLRSLANLRGGAPYQPPAGISFTPTTQRVRTADIALTRYRPRFYPGKIKFVRAETSSAFPDDAAAVWAPLAEKIEVETVPGDHLGIIATHYEALAAVLSRYLAEAFSGNLKRD